MAYHRSKPEAEEGFEHYINTYNVPADRNLVRNQLQALANQGTNLISVRLWHLRLPGENPPPNRSYVMQPFEVDFPLSNQQTQNLKLFLEDVKSIRSNIDGHRLRVDLVSLPPLLEGLTIASGETVDPHNAWIQKIAFKDPIEITVHTLAYEADPTNQRLGHGFKTGESVAFQGHSLGQVSGVHIGNVSLKKAGLLNFSNFEQYWGKVINQYRPFEVVETSDPWTLQLKDVDGTQILPLNNGQFVEATFKHSAYCSEANQTCPYADNDQAKYGNDGLQEFNKPFASITSGINIKYQNKTQFFSSLQSMYRGIIDLTNDIKYADGIPVVRNYYIGGEYYITKYDDPAGLIIPTGAKNWYFDVVWPDFYGYVKANGQGIQPSIYFFDSSPWGVTESGPYSTVRESEPGYQDIYYPELNGKRNIVFTYRTLRYLVDNNLPVPKTIDLSLYVTTETQLQAFANEFEQTIPNLLNNSKIKWGVAEGFYLLQSNGTAQPTQLAIMDETKNQICNGRMTGVVYWEPWQGALPWSGGEFNSSAFFPYHAWDRIGECP